jgi:hypothetical protein
MRILTSGAAAVLATAVIGCNRQDQPAPGAVRPVPTGASVVLKVPGMT